MRLSGFRGTEFSVVVLSNLNHYRLPHASRVGLLPSLESSFASRKSSRQDYQDFRPILPFLRENVWLGISRNSVGVGLEGGMNMEQGVWLC